MLLKQLRELFKKITSKNKNSKQELLRQQSTPNNTTTIRSAADIPRVSHPSLNIITPKTTFPSAAKNLEGTTLLWCDPNIGKEKDTEKTMKELREINDYVIFHTDEDQCVEYIKTVTEEKIFLVISGQCASSGMLLKQIHPLRQVDSIFIFCLQPENFKHLLEEYCKIVGIYCERRDLIASIKENVELVGKQLGAFCFYNQHREKSTRNLSKESAEFLWFQLFKDVILRLPRDNHSKHQLIEFCRQYYHGNEEQLRLIDEFQNSYTSGEAIKWYTRETFLYKLVNKALRTEDVEQLYTFRYFIADLSLSLTAEYQHIRERQEDVVTLYRGLKVDEEEFLILKQNEGNLISTNGFLSTSRCRNVALAFATKPTQRTNVISILYEIECNVKDTESIVFADIAKFSDYTCEQEVMFDLGTTYRIVSIREDTEQKLWIIKMKATDEGAAVAREYIELNRKQNLDETAVIIMFGKLLARMGKYDQSLKYFHNLLDNHLTRDEDIAVIYNYIGTVHQYKGDFDKGLENFERAYNLMMNSTPQPRIKDSAKPLRNMGNISYERAQYDKALELYIQALEIFEMHYGNEHIETALTLNSIGLVYHKRGHYVRSLDYHEKSLRIKQKQLPSAHCDIATSLMNIGSVYRKMNEFNRSLEYYQKSLEMKKKLLPPEHIAIAASLMYIADVFSDQGQLNRSLEYYFQALKMQEKIFEPNGHTSIAQSLNNIGRVYQTMNKLDQALDYYQKSLDMNQKLHSSQHVDTAESLIGIGNVLRFQGQLTNALEYYFQALEIQEKVYGLDSHPDIAMTLMNLGSTYEKMNEFDQALEYHQKSLKMKQELLPIEYNAIAGSLMGIGTVLCRKGQFDNGLEYYFQALSYQEKIFGVNGHSELATTLRNMACLHEDQHNFATALAYYRKALKMNIKCLPSDHPHISQLTNDIASVKAKI
ncbi:unnamed protein product [Didymodactylos carnosus]|uniref:ADP ribosyltransferase domain-containing protein n=1 Tax=Didymodactylos carnosus TaxID=1234261 RepID=A0A815KRP5_9BILA|nr:unnamed protein product [Didymodactylos carnosus]CAF1396831.1 unnamed protein product [Didymodactylos carnosus]CAF3678630.1 unnamed protein product [Didymodactylos carnosus]CAF4290940.1 unnamed protein product [Didymodactylos carnosus]